MKRFNAANIAGLLTAFVPIGLVVGNVASDAAIIIVALLFLLESIRTKEFGWVKKPWIVVLILLWAYGCARSLVVGDMESLGRAAPWIRYVIFAVALENWVFKEEKWRRCLLYSSLAATGFLAADTLLQYFRGTDILGHPWIGQRLTATFVKPIVGVTMAWLFLPVLAWLLGEKRFVSALLYAALCFSAILFSGERMALLFALCSFGLLALFEARLRKIAVLSLVGIVIIAGAAMFLRPELYERQVQSTAKLMTNLGDSHYGAVWDSAYNITKDHPIFGVGILNFRKICPDEKYGPLESGEKKYPRCANHTHNIYIEWMAEAGIIGLAGLLFFGFFVMRGFIRLFPYHKNDYVFLALFAMVIMRLFPLSSSASFHSNWSAIPLWLALGWGLSYGGYKRIESQKGLQ